MMKGQISIFDWEYSVNLQYKIAAVYEKIFEIKKFRNFIRDKKRNEIIEYLKFQGKYYLGVGWSFENSTIINVSPEGVLFNHEKNIYKFEEIADMLIEKYSI